MRPAMSVSTRAVQTHGPYSTSGLESGAPVPHTARGRARARGQAGQSFEQAAGDEEEIVDKEEVLAAPPVGELPRRVAPAQRAEAEDGNAKTPDSIVGR